MSFGARMGSFSSADLIGSLTGARMRGRILTKSKYIFSTENHFRATKGILSIQQGHCISSVQILFLALYQGLHPTVRPGLPPNICTMVRVTCLTKPQTSYEQCQHPHNEKDPRLVEPLTRPPEFHLKICETIARIKASPTIRATASSSSLMIQLMRRYSMQETSFRT
jgi:hypothetical protein